MTTASVPGAPGGGTHPPLTWLRAVDHPELMAPSTHAALVAWAAVDPSVAEGVSVAAITGLAGV